MVRIDEKALAPQRWHDLRTLIREHGVIRVDDLCRVLKVSAATVRRDLDELDRAGAIRRVHGGAVSVESRMEEPVFADKDRPGRAGEEADSRGGADVCRAGRHDLPGRGQHRP